MHIISRSLFAGVALLTVMASGANARPSFGADCASCHDRSAGALNVIPNLLELLPNGMGAVTFDVTELGSAGEDAAIAVFGLDAADLDATPDLTGWTSESGGSYLSSDFFNSTGQVVLNLSLGTGAMLGDFPINVTMAGGPGSDWSTMRSLTIRVIPEPATLALLGVALVPVGILVRKRFRRRATGTCYNGRCRFK